MAATEADVGLGEDVAASPRGPTQLVPGEGSFRGSRGHQRQHQVDHQAWRGLPELALPASESSKHGGQPDRIHGIAKCGLKWGTLQILAQSRFSLGE